MATTRRKTAPRASGRKSKSQKKSWLQSLLYVLVIFLVLAAIAMIAGYVYMRKNATPEPTLEVQTEIASKTEGADQSSPDNSKPIQKQANVFIEGTWVSTDNGAMLTIKGTNFTIDFPSVESGKPITGTIQFIGNEFTVISKTLQGCEQINGSYSFDHKGEDLVVKAINDSCSKRKNSFESSWFKM